MQTAAIRQKLNQYIDNGDERLLKLLLAVAKEYNNDEESAFELTAEDIKEFDTRREKRLNGESKVYSWEEAKEMITKKKSIS